MTLDLPTLMLAGSFVGTLCGAALIFVWLNGREPAALWWAASCLTVAATVGLLAIGSVRALPLLFFAGLTANLVSPVLLWSGIRVFHGKPVPVLAGAGGLAIWLLTAGTTGLHGAEWVPPICNTLIVVAYNGAAAWELAFRGIAALRARLPLIALICVNVVVFLMAIPDALLGDMQGLELAPLTSAFGLIHFETMIFLIGTTVAGVALIKEKGELHLLRDAQTDPLTGLANRRAFYEMADRVAERCTRKGQAISVVVFDLDHFKNVNDRFGHTLGDDVLRLFAKVARDSLRPGDIVGRVGGEEFFAVLPDSSLADGCTTANRVRSAFAAVAASVGGRDVKATVSAGVMASDGAAVPLSDLFEEADAALYRAKINGRNRVECGMEKTEQTYPRLVRVA